MKYLEVCDSYLVGVVDVKALDGESYLDRMFLNYSETFNVDLLED